jgi:hypothetical protein
MQFWRDDRRRGWSKIDKMEHILISRRRVLIVIVAFFFSGPLGCATTEDPFYLDIEQAKNIRNIGLVINLAEKGNKVFDPNDHIRKTTVSKNYGGITRGALGVAIERTILEFYAAHKIEAAIGGNIEELDQALHDYPIEKEFESNFMQGFSEGLSQSNRFNCALLRSQDDFVTFNPDVVVLFDYTYGLGVREKWNPKIMIYADVNVIDNKDKRLLVYRNLSSGYFYTGYRYAEYLEENGQKFKEEFEEAARGLGTYTATIFY